jgi:CubicO group peptidase (beta-lactamase class C family)
MQTQHKRWIPNLNLMVLRGVMVLIALTFIFLPYNASHNPDSPSTALPKDSLLRPWSEPDVEWVASNGIWREDSMTWAQELEFGRNNSQLDSIFTRMHRKKRLNATVLVAEKGKILHMGAYGYGNFDQKDTLDVHANFQLASLSKIFTATAVMLLQEDGLIDFDDPVKMHLPEFPYEKITIRHLLNHRSGMSRYMWVAAQYWKTWQIPMSNQDALNQFSSNKPVVFFQPGRRFNYCNTNYVFLASIVERVSGIPFDVFVAKRIFDPLEMENSIVYSRLFSFDVPDAVNGYKGSWKGLRVAATDYLDGVMGDKGVYSNVADLYQFDRALYENRLLRPETLEEAYRPGTPNRASNYGFGWRMKLGKNKIVYHFGWWRGFKGCFIRDLRQERTLIILSNVDAPGYQVPYWEVFRQVNDAIDKFRPLPRAVPANPKSLSGI